MPKPKQTPVVGNLVEKTTKTTGNILSKTGKSIKKNVPGAKSVTNVASKGLVKTNEFVNKIPIFGRLKQKVTSGINAVAKKVPIIKNARKGVVDAFDKKKTSSKKQNTKSEKTKKK